MTTVKYTVRFRFERGNVVVCVDSRDAVAAVEDAKKELVAQFASPALLSRVKRIDVYEGGREDHES